MTRPVRVEAAAAILAAAASFCGTQAWGHGGGVPTVAVIERVDPGVAGIVFETVRSYQPSLQVSNDTGEPLVVLGEEGEPFVRVGPDGAEVNTRSPTAYRAANPFYAVQPPADADAGAEPGWRAVSSDPRWRWFDPRVRLEMPSAAPASPARRRWTIEAEHRGRSIVVEGRSEVAGRHGHLQTVLEAVPDGDLDVRVFEGEVPVIFVRNDGALRFDIPGLEGEPFLRIGPDGVEGNARSPTFHRAARQRIGEVPADADPNAAPEWTTLSSTSAWGWLEFRARVPEGDDPFSGTRDPLALGSRKRTVLRWEVPSTLADEMAPMRGRVDWVPAVEASATPSLWAVVAAAVAALVLIVPIRRAVRRVRASRRGNLPTG